MTVLPERLISSFFREVIESLLTQTQAFEKLTINIPEVCKRSGQIYQIPEWLFDVPKVSINRCEDLGPGTKLLGIYSQLDPDDVLCVVDDDIIYMPTMLEKLVKAHRRFPKAIISTTLDPQGAPMGFSGYLFRKNTLNITDIDIDDLLCHCFFVDDTWLAKIAKAKGIKVLGITPNWLASMDQAKTDTHPDWFELGKHTDRDELVKKCLCSNKH